MLRAVRDDGSYTEDERNKIQSVAAWGIPSFLSDRYRRQAPDSSKRAWTLGLLGLLVPVLSVAGAVSGWRVERRGNRLGAVATGWCLLTGVVSVLWYADLIRDERRADDPPKVEIQVDLTAAQVGIVDEPPEGIEFPLDEQGHGYAIVEVVVTDVGEDDDVFIPLSLQVFDADVRRLPHRTLDRDLFSRSRLSPGDRLEGRLYVALLDGRGPPAEVRYREASDRI